MAIPDYPFLPRSLAELRPGQFWPVPLSNHRYACGRVLAVDATERAQTFVAGLLDWVGDEPPTVDAVAGASLLEMGRAPLDVITLHDNAIAGEVPVRLDEQEQIAKAHFRWGPDSCLASAERHFVAGERRSASERRTITSPLTEEMLRPSVLEKGVIQFNQPLRDHEFERLARWVEEHPGFTLRAYGSTMIRDLEFLRFFPSLRRFEVDGIYDLESLNGLRYLPEHLQALGIGSTRRKLDLCVLDRFNCLEALHLVGQTRNIEAVSRLTSLSRISLRSITLPDLTLLLPLRKLESFELRLGGTRDLRLLPQIGQLRYLEVWRVRGLEDLSAVGELTQLRYLFLQTLRGVTSLPSLDRLEGLQRVHLETMKGIRDLQPLATAPNLEELLLLDMPQLDPRDLQPLVGLPRLRAVTATLGTFDKNRQARRLLRVPPVVHAFDWQKL